MLYLYIFNQFSGKMMLEVNFQLVALANNNVTVVFIYPDRVNRTRSDMRTVPEPPTIQLIKSRL